MSFKDFVSEIKAMLVIDYERGQRLGRVIDIFIDKEARQIAGFSFRGGLFETDRPLFMRTDNVHKFGRDVIFISDPAAVIQEPPEFVRHSVKDLRGLPVTTTQGRRLGRVADLTITTDSGRIAEIMLSEGKRLAVEPEAITLGPDAVMVPTDYEVRLQEADAATPGILAHIFDLTTIGETVMETGQYLGERLRSTAEKMGEIMTQSLRRNRDREASYQAKKDDPPKETNTNNQNSTDDPFKP